MTSRTHMKRKDVDDVLGGEDQWKHADSIMGLFRRRLLDCDVHKQATAQCDKCEHDRAYFYQLQIRSADEPMTTCMCGCSLFGVTEC
jgi:DNA-directed RNA polymerase III subunit RPC11